MARKKTVKRKSAPAPAKTRYDAVRERLLENSEHLKARLQENSEKLRQLQTKAHQKMSDNPMQTAAVAFGIGVIVGVGVKLLIDNKRRE